MMIRVVSPFAQAEAKDHSPMEFQTLRLANNKTLRKKALPSTLPQVRHRESRRAELPSHNVRGLSGRFHNVPKLDEPKNARNRVLDLAPCPFAFLWHRHQRVSCACSSRRSQVFDPRAQRRNRFRRGLAAYPHQTLNQALPLSAPVSNDELEAFL